MSCTSRYAVVTTTIRRRFDGRSTEVLRSQCRNTSVPADTLAAVTFTCIFNLGRITYGRDECRRMVVARWKCSRMGVEAKSGAFIIESAPCFSL